MCQPTSVSSLNLLLLFTMTYKSILEPRFDPRVLFFVYFMCQADVSTAFSSTEYFLAFHTQVSKKLIHIFRFSLNGGTDKITFL